MKCFTCYGLPGLVIKSEPGISVIKTSNDYAVRIGRNGLLSTESLIYLMTGDESPFLYDSVNGMKIMYDAFPVELKSKGQNRYMFAKPNMDYDSVTLVRFSFGGQVPADRRAEVFPSCGKPNPIGIAHCAMNRTPWPVFAIDGIWIASVGDSFTLNNADAQRIVRITEEGIITDV